MKYLGVAVLVLALAGCSSVEAAGSPASSTPAAAASTSSSPTPSPSTTPSSTPTASPSLTPARRTNPLSYTVTCENLNDHISALAKPVSKALDDYTSVTSGEIFDVIRPIDKDRANAPKDLSKLIVPLVKGSVKFARTLDEGGTLSGNDIADPADPVINACEKQFKKDAAAEKKANAAAKKKAKARAKAEAKREAAEAELENAIGSAESYLAYSAFSRKGLIEQLSSDAGEGYPLKIATKAVDSLDVDYNKQATKAAKAYLKYSHFSHSGLVEQLESSYGDGYTHSQAEYGVSHAGL